MPRAIVLHPDDNVGTLIDPGAPSQIVQLTGKRADTIILAADVPYGHKCAIRAIASGDKILKYGQVIGRATQPIAVGQHVHTHNVEALRARGDVKEKA